MNNFEMKPITKYFPAKVHPSPFNWEYIKHHDELFIDDIAYGMPLKKAAMTNGNMVDWDELDRQFIENGMYNKVDSESNG